MERNKVLFTSWKQDWKTPKSLYNKLKEEFDFDFDPCPPQHKVNGLEIEWGFKNFINPPFKDVSKWVKKAYEESCKEKQCVLLVASRTDTRWFHDYVLPYAKEIRFIKGRIKFEKVGSNLPEKKWQPAPFPSVIIIFDGRNL